jgi:hypothetical protein
VLTEFPTDFIEKDDFYGFCETFFVNVCIIPFNAVQRDIFYGKDHNDLSNIQDAANQDRYCR